MASLADLIAARAAHDGAAPFLESATTTRFITYAQCNDAVHRWRTVLAQNARPGAAIALSIMDPLDFCLAYLGALSCGYRVLPIDPGLPAAMRADAFAPAALVISDNVAGAIRTDAYVNAAPRRAPGGSGAVELRSSGTTGPAKLVRLSEKQLLCTATNVARHHRIVPGERGLSPLPLFHINAEVVGLLATLVGGATLVLDAGFHRSRFWDTVHAHDVTWINAVPAIISILASVPDGPANLPRVRFVRSASAPLPETTRRAFEARSGVPVIESYGMTEAASQITVFMSRRPYLPPQLDLIRAVTFSCVVLVHVLLYTALPTSIPAYAMVQLLHFTRETFFALTAFVLCYTQYGKLLQPWRFRARRYALVLPAYVLWNVLYTIATEISTHGSTGSFTKNLLHNICTGYWHLYFVFVMMQLYLMFPLLWWLVRKTQGHHLLLLVGSLAFELVLMAYLRYDWPTRGVFSYLREMCRSNRFPLPYQGYIIARALAAVHIEQFHAWIRRSPKMVGIGVAGAAGMTLAVYFQRLGDGASPGTARTYSNQ